MLEEKQGSEKQARNIEHQQEKEEEEEVFEKGKKKNTSNKKKSKEVHRELCDVKPSIHPLA